MLSQIFAAKPTVSVGCGPDAPPVARSAAAPSSWWTQWSSVIITAVANFGVQYNYAAISVALVWIHPLFGQFELADSLCNTAAFVGTLIGMTSFGAIGDILGRSEAMVVTLSIMAGAAFLSGMLPMGSDISVYVILVCCRLCIGIGAGGVYPLAAAKSSEDCPNPDVNKKAQAAAWAFFWRNPGQIWVYALGIILALSLGVPPKHYAAAEGAGAESGARHKSSLTAVDGGLEIFIGGWDLAWRIYLASGCVAPALVALAAYWELRARPAKVDGADISAPRPTRRASLSSHPHAPFAPATSLFGSEPTSLRSKLVDAQPGRSLVCTAGGWALFDFGFYGNIMLLPRVLAILLPKKTENPTDGTAAFVTDAYVAICVAAVGVGFTLMCVPLIPRMGLKNVQILGFVMNAILSFILGCSWKSLHTASTGDGPNSTSALVGLLVLYTLLLGSYWVCNVTTYSIPTAVFEAEVRSTLHGLSAAAGKLGAIGGTLTFAHVLKKAPDQDMGLVAIMHSCGVLAVLGVAVTWYGTPELGPPLEAFSRRLSRLTRKTYIRSSLV